MKRSWHLAEISNRGGSASSEKFNFPSGIQNTTTNKVTVHRARTRYIDIIKEPLSNDHAASACKEKLNATP